MANRPKASRNVKEGGRKVAARRAVDTPSRGSSAPTELRTLLDFVRYAVSRFVEAKLVFAHGTTDPVSEAAFLVCEALHLTPDQFEMFATARTTQREGGQILELIDRRVATRQPAAYLVSKAYMRGLPFYVDERAIVPRSFIGEILESHFGREEGEVVLGDPAAIRSVLDLCTGSGCLAILASRQFPDAEIDAVDLSADALAVAARNVADYDLQDRISLHQGDLFAAVGRRTYDLIISNPPYVDAQGMAGLPPECRHEPALAFDGGDDGLKIVRRIIDAAREHLNGEGGLLCEIGRCQPALESAYPELPLLWLDTEDSTGEVFWASVATLPHRALRTSRT